MKIAVVGAGHGGIAAAADMALAGHDVSLFQIPSFAESFQKIKETKEINLTGVTRQGTAKLNKATHDVQEALAGAEVVLVITPAFAQETMAKLCAPFIEDGQYIFLIPGGFGSYIFAKVFKDLGINKDVTIGETATLPYGCRINGPNEVAVHIRTIYNPFATYPAERTAEAVAILKQLYPETAAAKNILDVALNNTNPCVHPIPTLLSAGRIEHAGGEFWLYREGISPSVWRAMRALDAERLAIRRAFGLTEPHCALPEEVGRVFTEAFGYNGIEAGRKMKGPKSLADRYLTEDVPFGLVFYSSIARFVGIPTPIIDSVINLAGALLDDDLWSAGRSLNSLGLAEMDQKAFSAMLGEYK